MNKPGIVERWSLAGSIAMVTGGTKGIGAGIVSELVMHGATVVAVARNIDTLSGDEDVENIIHQG
ncbi:MAG: SDR family NAD(P)-dependent oxidoreductase [Bacteroidales bacterium]